MAQADQEELDATRAEWERAQHTEPPLETQIESVFCRSIFNKSMLMLRRNRGDFRRAMEEFTQFCHRKYGIRMVCLTAGKVDEENYETEMCAISCTLMRRAHLLI